MTVQSADDGPKFPSERTAESAVAAERAAAPLQRLIQQRLRERNWSYGEVARRGGLPRSTVYTLATTRNLVRPPPPPSPPDCTTTTTRRPGRTGPATRSVTC